MTILVTGATGAVGRGVVDLLREAGVPVRPASRNPAGDTRKLDLTDPGTFAEALDGVDKVFLYAEPSTADVFVEAAEQAGVRHVVVLSSISVGYPGADKNPIALRHSQVEYAVQRSGLGWTFLRGGFFATNIRQWAQPIREDGVARIAYPEQQVAPVHEKDIAAVAIASLREDRHNKEIYTLTGPESLTMREIIAHIAEDTGRPIELKHLNEEEALQDMTNRLRSKEAAEAMLRYMKRTVGVAADVTDDVERATGTPARTFQEWVRDHRKEFVA